MRPGFRDWDAGFGGGGPGPIRRSAGFGGRAFGGPQLMGAPFMDAVGHYAIHIIVNNRSVTLAGVVDNNEIGSSLSLSFSSMSASPEEVAVVGPPLPGRQRIQPWLVS